MSAQSRRSALSATTAPDDDVERAGPGDAPPQTMLGALVGQMGAPALRRMIQRRRAGQAPAQDAPDAIQAAADRGTRGAGGALPHRDAIQRSFGRHDVS